MKIINQVKVTNDYEMFKSLDGNRNVNKLHVNRLKESFRKKHLLSPILINHKNEIIDGQHRFQAAKELELPVYFIQVHGYGLNEVQLLNTNMKNWGKKDYLNAYCDLKYPEYLKFRNFMRRYPDFGISACETILTDHLGGGKLNKPYSDIDPNAVDGTFYSFRYFQEGELKISNYERAVDNAEKIMMIKPYYDGFNRAVFVRAMIGIFKIEYYDHSKMISKIANRPSALENCSNVTQYKLLLEDIYNFRNREKISLRF